MCTQMFIAGFTHDHHKLRSAQSPSMGEQTVVHLYHGIPLGNKKEATIETQDLGKPSSV